MTGANGAPQQGAEQSDRKVANAAMQGSVRSHKNTVSRTMRPRQAKRAARDLPVALLEPASIALLSSPLSQHRVGASNENPTDYEIGVTYQDPDQRIVP